VEIVAADRDDVASDSLPEGGDASVRPRGWQVGSRKSGPQTFEGSSPPPGAR